MTKGFPVINKRETAVKLRTIMNRRGITAKQIQEYLGLGCVQSVYRWLSGQSMPTIDNLYALSELFQATIDDMICGNRKLNQEALYSSGAQYRRLQAYYVRVYGFNVV